MTFEFDAENFKDEKFTAEDFIRDVSVVNIPAYNLTPLQVMRVSISFKGRYIAVNTYRWINYWSLIWHQ